MTTLLCVLVFGGVVNTLAMLWCAINGALPQLTNFTRVMDATYTFCIGMWALWLLAKAT